VISKEVLNIVSKVEAGVFTSGLYNSLKANQAMTPLELKAKLDAELKKYQQTVTLETTSPEMLDESLFLPNKNHKTDTIDGSLPPVEPAPPESPYTPAPAATPAPAPVPVAKPDTPAPAPTAPSPAPTPAPAPAPAAKPYTPAPTPVPAAKPSTPAAAPEPTGLPKLPSMLAETGAAFISAFAARPATAAATRPRVTFTASPATPQKAQKRYQQPVVSYVKDGKKTELHHYLKKVRGDHTIDIHVISTTLEQNGRKPVVTHVAEVTKTDKGGRVTTFVQQYGDDLPWNAAKSKWNASAVVAKSAAPAAPATKTRGKDASAAKAAPAQVTNAPVNAPSSPFVSQPIDWPHLPLYYLTAEEREKLTASKATLRLTSHRLATTDEFRTAAKQIYSKFATTNMTYGCWHLAH
jgi:hypothetical protein